VPGLHRYYGAGHLHYTTTSCYHRRGWLATEPNRDLFVEVLEQVRRRCHFVVVGYVVMPEARASSVERTGARQSLRGDAGHQAGIRSPACSGACVPTATLQGDLWNQSLNPQHVWQRRFYDFVVRTFVVRTYEKRQEKLHYIHQNPVRASLALEPWQWRWSSAPHYLRGESGPVLVNELVMAEMKIRPVA
jgi:putative transposase